RMRPRTPQERDAFSDDLGALEEAFGRLDHIGSILVIYWLFPAFRDTLKPFLNKHAIPLPDDEGELRKIGYGAMVIGERLGSVSPAE
ncbi:MAG: hypothetical protein JSS20_08220, partial [Proteobacteria bacterium]|nr:hypothetical protein [Pseudomonadota bacterium]